MAKTKCAPGSIKDICRGMSTGARRRYFATDEAIRVVGAKIARDEHRRMLLELKRLRSDVPSDAWTDAVDNHGAEFPPGRKEIKTPHGARMIVSTVSGRYTPPLNLSDEDQLDAMTEFQALWYEHPASVSAMAIQQIRANKAREVGGKWR